MLPLERTWSRWRTLSPVIKEALARLFHNGDTKGVECMGTSIGPKPIAHEQTYR